MRKLFTSIIAALCLAASVGTLSAQAPQLTDAQKEAFKKEVMPVIFEQIKEQAGIDILGWANPQLSSTLSGIPVLESSNLRSSSTSDAITIKPDSIVISTSLLSNINPALASIVSLLEDNIKITFEDYTTTTLPVSIGDTPITVELPSTINVSSLAYIHFNSNTESSNWVDFDVDLSIMGTSYDLVACTLGLTEESELEANVDIQDGLRSLMSLLNVTIPEVDYRITVGLFGLPTGSIPATLYSVAEGDVTNVTPMGRAILVLNTSNNAMFPIEKIEVTDYVAGEEYFWSTFNFDMTMTASSSSLVYNLNVDRYDRNDADADSTFKKRTIISLSDYTVSFPTTTQAAVQSVVSRAVNELANDGEASWYKMTIEQTENEDGANTQTVATIEVIPSMSDTEAIADVDITINNNATYTVRATADLTGNNVITVDVVKDIDSDNPVTYGTAYFTSNIAGAVTANESVEESVVTMRIVPTDDAIRIYNVEQGNYRIVSMTGAIVASGRVNGDTYVPTASLSKGIYILAVEADGKMQSVKIMR